MKTTTARLNALKEAMMKVVKEEGRRIEFFNTSPVTDTKICFGVNWSALGTVDSQTTKRFAQRLERAAEVCEFVNSLELEEAWGVKDERITDLEMFENCISAYAMMLMDKNKKALEELLKIEEEWA